MSKESISVTGIVPATPERVFGAWLDGEEHGAMTGASAEVEGGVGCKFSAWNGYITGTTLEVEESARILQSWRSGDFAEEDGDSQLEILLKPVEGGTQVTFNHSDIPAGQGQMYTGGWDEHYLQPMCDYFTIFTK